MKAKILPFCVLMAAGAHAQPTLTNANNFTAGLSFLQYSVPSAPQGAAGANVTWDFSNIGTSTGLSYSYTGCSSSSSCATFPGSNMVVNQASGTGYFIVDNTRQALNGAAAGGTNVIYSNPEDMLRFPFTYNDTYTDTYAASFVSGGINFSRSGTVTVTADGYGTLKLPNGTYNNVLRVKRVETFSDTWSGPTINYTTEMYTWYSPAKREYLLSKSTTTANGSVTNNPMLYTNQTPTAVGTLAIAEGSVSLYPTPAAGTVHLRFSTEKNVAANVTLMDLAGRQALPARAFQAAQGMNELTLNTEDLGTGIYMLRLEADGQSIIRKVSVR